MTVILIQNGVVKNIICADSVERAKTFYPEHICIEQLPGTQQGIGWITEDNGVTFHPPLKEV